ncbi:hypothetical protein [Christiangramia salexigens]|nr:hypothetical protein [Christiangramia salexigens]
MDVFSKISEYHYSNASKGFQFARDTGVGDNSKAFMLVSRLIGEVNSFL